MCVCVRRRVSGCVISDRERACVCVRRRVSGCVISVEVSGCGDDCKLFEINSESVLCKENEVGLGIRKELLACRYVIDFMSQCKGIEGCLMGPSGINNVSIVTYNHHKIIVRK